MSGKFFQALKINFSFDHDIINDLCSLLEEILECAILLNSDLLFLVLRELSEVIDILVNQMEWEIIHIKTLCEIVARNGLFFVFRELEEFIVPNHFLKFVSEFEELLASDF